tara:strand:- start:6 stop:1367 length:1362 start_codon:yes stop_codon:yes gene_type:complete
MAENKTAQTSSDTVPSFVTKADIKGNEEGEASLVGGFVQLNYHESILQDSVRADYIFADAGNSVDGKSVMEGLPVVGTEDFTLAFEDNQGEKLEFSEENKNTLIVNKVTPQEADAAKMVVSLSLVSEEFIRNDEGASHINVRMDGKISDHIKMILEDYLKTEKDIEDIEETKNNYNFVGNNKKPFWTMNWLSKFGVPNSEGEEGKTAGFFFWETSEGYHFKSIDGLFAQEAKKRFIFNSTGNKGEIPPSYDGKILEMVGDNRIDYQNKIRMGAYGTKLVVFNPFNCLYEVVPQTADEAEEGTTTAGEGLPKFNKKFKNPSDEENFTRTTFMFVDAGTLPSGTGEGKEQEQVEKSEEENFESQKVLNQGIRRYNQFFAQLQTVTIAGDFSLHAGDAIYIDSPSVQTETTDEVNKETGGLYIIADLCHYVSSKETYTKMTLVRDSFGRVAESASV